MMSNPEMVQRMMDNPMVQSLMSNPDVMRQLITSNPQMRDLMEVRLYRLLMVQVLSQILTLTDEDGVFCSPQGVSN